MDLKHKKDEEHSSKSCDNYIAQNLQYRKFLK